MINITDKSNCCGCSACMSICSRNAITMREDAEGFIYPHVDKNLCIDCGLCEKVCPIQYRDATTEFHKPVGYFAGRLKCKEDLLKSSSGGFFWALADYVISLHGVVVGAEYSDNLVVRHNFAYTLEECSKFQGSKYSQSNVIGVFPKIRNLLQSDKIVLFSGTPCQIEGLNCYLRKPYDNLITMDVVCHAVPSPKFFKDYCEYVRHFFKKKLVAIKMRDKADHGWSHHFSYRYIFSDGSDVLDCSKITTWGHIFFSQYINRPSCHSCRFANLQRPGDITVADFWDDNHNRDDIYDKNGTSLILLNTKKGTEVFDNLKKTLDVFELDEKDSVQPCLRRPTPQNPKRALFWDFYQKNGFAKTYKKFFTMSFFAKVKRKLKKILKIRNK